MARVPRTRNLQRRQINPKPVTVTTRAKQVTRLFRTILQNLSWKVVYQLLLFNPLHGDVDDHLRMSLEKKMKQLLPLQQSNQYNPKKNNRMNESIHAWNGIDGSSADNTMTKSWDGTLTTMMCIWLP